MNPNIFRQYDIRGDAERDLPDHFARDLGRALGTFWMRRDMKRVALGRDCRLSSPRIHAAMVEGLAETGVSVLDIGVVPTPLMYFTVFHHELDGGVMITGSHNPPEDNGFKMMKGRGSLFGDDVQELRRIIEARDFESGGGGERQSMDVLPAYVAFVRENVALARTDLRIAIDAGNGAAGPTALATLRALGVEPVALHCEMDGTFPAHHPDPTDPENLEELIATVKDQGLDLGIAFDGDGDRLGIVDADGTIRWGDQLMVLLSRDLLRRRPGAAILGEVKCSQVLYDDIASHGGRPILWKTGHSLIKAKMKEEGALLAGEMSGHIFFADKFYGFDDATYAAARVLEVLSRGQETMGERLADLPVTEVTPELRVPCPDEEKFGVVEQVKAHFGQTHEVIAVDGARILFGDGAWGLVRASNTQPVLVLRFEAKDVETRDRIRAEVEAVVREARGGEPLSAAAPH